MAQQIRVGIGRRARILPRKWCFISVINLVAVAHAGAQTSVDLRNQSKNVDFSAAASTRVWRMGSVLPATCNVGEGFFLIGSGPNLYVCSSQNVWSSPSGSPSVGAAIAGSGTELQSVNGVFELDAVPVIDGTGTEVSSGCTAISGSMTCQGGYTGGSGPTRFTASEGAIPPAPTFGQQTIYVDSADHNLKSIDGTGLVRLYTTEVAVPHIIPFAASPAGNASTGVTFPPGQWAPTDRAGTYNIGAALEAVPSSGAALQFDLELPQDWDTTKQPYIRVSYGSGSNTSGTVVWMASSACSSSDGSVTDDPPFNAESSWAAQTMTTANSRWAQSGQFTAMTSANHCVAGSPVTIKVTLSGTALSPINAYQAVVTIPEIPAVQAN
jgi:hypothetical protein